MKTFLQSLKTLLIAVVLFAGVVLVSAQVGTWTPPSQPPTDGNTPAPLNVGTLDQVKNAGLVLNRLSVLGQVQINDGTAAVGKVLTSLDNLGTTQWAAVGAGGVVPDLEYKTSTTNTGRPADNVKEVTATCSVGKKVVSGGCAGVGPYLIITGSLPTSDGTGWFCRADAFSVYYGPYGGGVQYGAVNTLTARAICQ